MLYPIVTIDGPAASGKSSVSRELAKKLNQNRGSAPQDVQKPRASSGNPQGPEWCWVSTGVFYRATAFMIMSRGRQHDGSSLQAHLRDESQFLANRGPEAQELETEFVKWAQSDQWWVQMEVEQTAVYCYAECKGRLDNQTTQEADNITHRLHHQNDHVGAMASKISQWPGVRKALLQKQRDCALKGPLIAEGRDCGTVVFPQAQYKFYLTARPEERAKRRSQDSSISVEHMTYLQQKRDQRDIQRQAAPLKKAPDAREIDTSQISLDEVVKKIYMLIKSGH